MNLLLKLIFVACVSLSLNASAEFIPCKGTKDCLATLQCQFQKKVTFTFSKFVACSDGVCSCKNKDGDFVAPKNCSEETEGSCQMACVKAAKSLSQCYIKVDNAYTCGNRCFCKFHLENLSKCRNNYDCGVDCDQLSSLSAIKKCKENAPPNYASDTRCDGAAICDTSLNLGTCNCFGSSHGVVGSLSDKACVNENICLKLCGTGEYNTPSEQKLFKEKLCSIVVNKTLKNHCFCPKKR